jgi:hypothetical protein
MAPCIIVSYGKRRVIFSGFDVYLIVHIFHSPSLVGISEGTSEDDSA